MAVPMAVAMPVTVTRDQFEQMVADALDSIPPELGDAMDNVVVVVEEWPTPEQLDGRPGTLLGLYEGVPLTSRAGLVRGRRARSHHGVQRRDLPARPRRRRAGAQRPDDRVARGRALLRHERRAPPRARLGLNPTSGRHVPPIALPYSLPMPYPKDLIQDGETLALDLRPHWWYFSRNIFTGIPLFILLVLVLNVDDDNVREYGGVDPRDRRDRRGRPGWCSSTCSGR